MTRSLITMLVDRTGSMGTIQAEAQGAINDFIDKQQAVEGKADLLLVDFDGQDPDNLVYDGKLKGFGWYNLEPRGMTPLYDAIGRTIGHAKAKIEMKKKGHYDHVFFVIVTDGQDNQSREYTASTVRRLISDKESDGWTFIFLASNAEAFAEGHNAFAGTQMIGQNTVKSDGTGVSYAAAASFTSDNVAATRGGQTVAAYGGDMTDGEDREFVKR